MTIYDPGYEEFTAHLAAEGVSFEDYPTTPRQSTPDAALPSEKTTKALTLAVTQELMASEASRREHMARVTDAWTAHDMTPYTQDEMILPEMEGMRVPLIFSRVAQAHGSLYGALAVRPFYKADVSEGQDGTVAMHAEAAIDEELERAEFENALDGALRGSLVGTCGFLKTTMNEDPDEPGEYRLDVEAVDIRELYLSPHEVRNLEQCNLIAHRYKTETWGWVWDNALSGVFDKKACEKILGATAAGDVWDGGGTERVQLGLENARSGSAPDDSKQVDMVEAYIRFRPAPDQPREWWRVHMEYGSKTILRAEKWGDDQPFTAIRHQRGNTTMYAPSFANILQDMQWASDMLMSASIEADKMGVSPVWKVNVLSPAMEYLRKRQAENDGHAVRPLPGDIIPTRNESDLTAWYQQPTPPQIDARLNRIEQYANLSTITVQPMTTYRSATEHRYAMANVSSKETQMLKVLRADLARLGEKIKRLMWKYRTVPMTEDTRQVIHGTIAYTTTAQQWAMLRLTPRGMTTSADQMLTMQATQEALQLTLTILPQKPMLMQAGIWPNVWKALDARLEALGIQDRVAYIGDNPVKDPNITYLDPIQQQREMQASLMLMQAQQGQMPQQQGGPGALPGVDGGSVRGSDGAPTVPPGGAMMPGVN